MSLETDFPVLNANDSHIRRCVIPGVTSRVTVRDGSVAFLQLHYWTWFNESIEPLSGRVLDDWGHNKRKIAGSNSWSKHARAIAVDGNALQHGRGLHTFTNWELRKITWHLRYTYRGCLESGAFWRNPDDMHVEVSKGIADCERAAKRLVNTRIGRRVLDANSGLRAAIYS